LPPKDHHNGEENIIITDWCENTLEEKMSKLFNEKHLKSEMQTYNTYAQVKLEKVEET
jgi:hypothetical protein